MLWVRCFFFCSRFDGQSYFIPDDVLIQSDLDHTIHFGKGDAPCNSDAPSSYPSSWPTFKLTNDPSKSPSAKPTPIPSRAPSTQYPTRSPLRFVGGYPEHCEPLQYYDICEQIQPGKLWRVHGGRKDGVSLELAMAALCRPHQTRPWPTETCTIKSGFNLCLALDNSGSVCNKVLARAMGC